MADKVRLGFVGVGGMGQSAHLRNYVTLPDCEVVAIAEMREGLGRKVAARYGFERVYRDHRDLLAREKLDGIVAIQSFYIHGRAIPELFAAGVPVITEKPISRSVQTAERIVAALRQSKAKYYVAYHKRSDPATMYARRQIDAWRQSGEFGAMRYVRVTMPPGDWVASGFSHLLNTDEPQPPLEFDPPQAGMDEVTVKRYDAFVNYYIHQVNLMRHLMGENYRVSFADPSGVVMCVNGERSGAAGTLEMSPYVNSIDWQEVALVAFERAWVRIDLPAPLALDRPGRVTMYTDPGNGATPMRSEPTLPWVHAMRQQAMNFVKAIRGEPTPLCEAEEALEDLRVAEAYTRMLLEAEEAGKRG